MTVRRLYNEKGEEVGLVEVMRWWLDHYEGMEHLTLGGRTNPQTWYTVSSILRTALGMIDETLEKGKVKQSV